MASQPEQPTRSAVTPHSYLADARVLSGKLEQPINTPIADGTSIVLPQIGGYQCKTADRFRVEGIISYPSAYAQVAGYRSPKADHGLVTLATAAVEGLNVLDVITADRVVGQISTKRLDPSKGEGVVPSVTFLGTRFNNLQIAGHKIEVELNLEIFRTTPAGGHSYFDDPRVLHEISKQYTALNRDKDLPAWLREKYHWEQGGLAKTSTISCSLVHRVSGTPGRSFGHVIDLPHFGKIFLGELTVVREKNKPAPDEPDQTGFRLNMIRLELGCIAHGSASILSLGVGTHGPGDGEP
jgi:hypothetical protein